MAQDAGMLPVRGEQKLQRKDGLIARFDLRLRKGVLEDEQLAEAIKEVKDKRRTGSTARTLRVLVFEEVERLRARSIPDVTAKRR